MKYDVIIVGGGPAGLFSALELSQRSGMKILMVEKGRSLEGRLCPTNGRGGTCPPCDPCNMVSGLGGAGAFSDGKLTLSSEVGGRLSEYISHDNLKELIKYVDSIYVRYGAPDKVWGLGEGVEEWRRKASLAEMRLTPMPVRHMGTDRSRVIIKEICNSVLPGIELRLETQVKNILIDNKRITGIETDGGEKLYCSYLILAPGREGADWLVKEARRLGLPLANNPVDLGVRVELPAAVTEKLTSELYEAKLEYFSKSFDDRVRVFCLCPHGEVTVESTGGDDPVTTVNGHSYAESHTENTNFALLVSISFTEPFHEPIAYGRYIARLANIISGGVLVQRLGDLREGHRSTPERMERGVVIPTLKGAVPGDLSFVLPYRVLIDIVEMLDALDKLVPGISGRGTLLYGVEVKFYSSRLNLTASLETTIKNLFAIGDGAGVTRGLIQASVSGVIAAREILRRESLIN